MVSKSKLSKFSIEELQTFRENKIFYATDLVGTDFKQCIDFSIRK